MATSPFFSGRIPQDLYDRIEQRVQETGENKTQILINALSAYLGYEAPLLNINSDKGRFAVLEERMSELESLITSFINQPKSQTLTEKDAPKAIDEARHQMSLLDVVITDNNKNSLTPDLDSSSDNKVDNINDNDKADITVINSDISNEIIVSTAEAAKLMDVAARTIGGWDKQGNFPKIRNGYKLIGKSDKPNENQSKSCFWRLEKI